MSRRAILALVRIDPTIGVAAVAAAVMASAGAAAPEVRSAPTILVALGDGTDSPIYRATLGDGVAHPVAGTRGVTAVFEGSATAALASRGGQLLRVPFRRDDRVVRLATLPGVQPDVLIPSRDATHVAAGIWCAEAARAMRVFGIYHTGRGVRRLRVPMNLPKNDLISIIPRAFDPRGAYLALTLETGECRGQAQTSKLLLLDIERNTSRRLDPYVESNVAFSPDGANLAYAAYRGRFVEIKVESLRRDRVRVVDRSEEAGGAAAKCCSVAWASGRLIYAIGPNVYSRPSGGGPRRHHGRLAGPRSGIGIGGGAVIVGVSRGGDRFAYVAAADPLYVYVTRVDGGRPERYPLPRMVGVGSLDSPSIRVSLD